MRFNYRSAHWLDGGTGLTNFDPKQFPMYEEAVRRHGDPHMAVSKFPMSNGGGSKMDLGSLHNLRLPRGQDDGSSSSFWRTFYAVQAEYAERLEKLEVERKRQAELEAERKREAEREAARKEAERKAPKTVEIGDWTVRLTIDNRDDLRIQIIERVPERQCCVF